MQVAHLLEEFLFGDSRHADDDCTRRDPVAADLGAGQNYGAVSDAPVVGYSHAAGQDDAIADATAAGNPDPAGDEATSPDPVVVADHDQVVDLGAAAYARRLDG